jgi:phosphate starvation-inducible protein PhoH
LTEVDVVRHRLVKEIIKAYARVRPGNANSQESE